MPFQQDFILRQIHQLAQVLARVIFLRQSGQHDEALAELRSAFDVAGVGIERIREMSRPEVIELCSTEAGFSSYKAVAVADLLFQEFEMLDEGEAEAVGHASGLRALWLYEASIEAGGILPADGNDRITRLRDRLGFSADDHVSIQHDD